jgi:hypothetical protein
VNRMLLRCFGKESMRVPIATAKQEYRGWLGPVVLNPYGARFLLRFTRRKRWCAHPRLGDP